MRENSKWFDWPDTNSAEQDIVADENLLKAALFSSAFGTRQGHLMQRLADCSDNNDAFVGHMFNIRNRTACCGGANDCVLAPLLHYRMLIHPNRVMDIKQADIAFVPIYV
jgi:hypothetical protein